MYISCRLLDVYIILSTFNHCTICCKDIIGVGEDLDPSKSLFCLSQLQIPFDLWIKHKYPFIFFCVILPSLRISFSQFSLLINVSKFCYFIINSELE